MDWRFDGAFLEAVNRTVVFQYFDESLDFKMLALRSDGRVAWHLSDCDAFWEHEDLIYVGGPLARCIEPSSGKFLAEVKLQSPVAVRMPIQSGPVFTSSEPPEILGLEPRTLSVLWRLPNPDEELVAVDGCLVRYREDGSLTVIELSDMNEIHTKTTPRATIGAILARNEDYLCEFPVITGPRRAVNIRTGATLWEFNDPPVYRSPVIHGSVCYAGDASGLASYDLTTGRPIWRQDFGLREVRIRSNLRLIRGRLYFSLHDGSIRVVEAETGKEVLSYRTGAEVEAVTALDENHLVYATKNLVTCLEVT